MATLPEIKANKTYTVMTDTFMGYNHQLKIPDGMFYDMKNMTSLRYPMLSSRPPRGTYAPVVSEYTQKTYKLGEHCTHSGKMYRCTTAINVAEEWKAEHWTETTYFANLQAIIAKDALYWVDSGILYANGEPTIMTGLQTAKETQLVSMGAYICIFPDKKYYNTMDPTDSGSMEASWVNDEQGASVTCSMCHSDGTVYNNVQYGSVEPTDPANGDLWVDPTEGTAKEYSSATQGWITLETVYTRVDFTTEGALPQLFKEYDGVQISGLQNDELNGSKVLYAVGQDATTTKDYIVIIGIQGTADTYTASVSISRTVPDMDYVCEAQNRLWGCFYGRSGTETLNEIYCCALGDFKNWEQYLGISTDSWRASRGSDGPFTGAVNYLGSPTFFKENVIHPVSVSSVGAHQIGDIPARGVQQGSHKSLAVVNETLYYKARAGVMAYQGGMPAEVGTVLGEERYYDAVAGAFGNRYYISMKDISNQWSLFCYDVLKGIWMREDNLHVECFTAWNDELYAQSSNSIIALNGTVGTKETQVEWITETGIQYYSYPDKKYVSKYDIRVNMARDAQFKIFIEYDSSDVWQYTGTVKLPNKGAPTGTMNVPVRPRRCDHMRIRLEGKGDVKVFSIARVLEKGSDK